MWNTKDKPEKKCRHEYFHLSFKLWAFTLVYKISKYKDNGQKEVQDILGHVRCGYSVFNVSLPDNDKTDYIET